MTKSLLGLVLALGTFSILDSAFAGGGTLNPTPPPRETCTTTTTIDGASRTWCTHTHDHHGGSGGGFPSGGGSTPAPTEYDCPTSVHSSADILNEGRLEVFATADHASTYLGSVSECHYKVQSLTVDGTTATAVQDLTFEFYGGGRIFLSFILANGEKARFVAVNGLLASGGKATSMFYVVPGFESADMYKLIRSSEGDDVALNVSASKVTVPVQNKP